MAQTPAQKTPAPKADPTPASSPSTVAPTGRRSRGIPVLGRVVNETEVPKASRDGDWQPLVDQLKQTPNQTREILGSTASSVSTLRGSYGVDARGRKHRYELDDGTVVRKVPDTKPAEYTYLNGTKVNLAETGKPTKIADLYVTWRGDDEAAAIMRGERSTRGRAGNTSSDEG